jgi:6-phospho-beta-glucosidase
MSALKVAVIGAGSTYTPELVSGLSRERDRIEVGELVLHDVDAERLDVVGALAARMLDRQSFGGRLELTTELDRALQSADVVLVQIRVGGQAARLSDETVPLACGCIGQETTGAGGFAKAMRTVPVVLEIADRARELASDDAWIVDFTNPVGIVTRALLDAGHRAVGLCNVAIGFQRSFARMLGVEPERVLVDQVGLNHLTWVRAVRVGDDDVLPELLDAHGEEIAADLELPVALLRELGVIPSYYLRYFYLHDRVLAEQREGVPRAEVVAEIERELLDLYRDPALSEKPALLERRGGAFYSEAATALVASLFADTGDPQVVDVRNEGTLAGFADDDVVEVPARIAGRGPEPLPQEPLAPELLGLAQHVAAYERLTAAAARSRDPGTARKALLTHPLVGQWEPAVELLDRLAAAESSGTPLPAELGGVHR